MKHIDGPHIIMTTMYKEFDRNNKDLINLVIMGSQEYPAGILNPNGVVAMTRITVRDIDDLLRPDDVGTFIHKETVCPHLYDPSMTLFYLKFKRDYRSKKDPRPYNHLATSLAKERISGQAILLFWDDRTFTPFDIISMGIASDRIDIEAWKHEHVEWWELLKSQNPLSRNPSFSQKVSPRLMQPSGQYFEHVKTP